VLATSVPYAVFVSTPLGSSPGGEYTHISRTFGSRRLAFVGVWLKIISYLGALAYLARAFADYLLGFSAPAALAAGGPAGGAAGETVRTAIALGILGFFFAIHARGVRWFGSLQVWMCALLALSIAVLVVPGCFAIEPAHYSPFFTGGARGFLAALPLLFFAYAGFESLAQTAGEVRDSTRLLPAVFLRGVLVTSAIFTAMSTVAFGVLPGENLRGSTTPMADVARVYLPRGGAWIVVLGALMAITTSINATMLVPSRLALVLAADGLAPAWLGRTHPRTGTPVRGLALTFGIAALLLVSGQLSMALGIAVLALVILYLLHSAALLVVPRTNPALYAARTVRLPDGVQKAAAWLSIASLAALLAVMIGEDLRTLRALDPGARFAAGRLTSLELLLGWSFLGLCVHELGRAQRGTRSPGS
jgi:amino acid transporter